MKRITIVALAASLFTACNSASTDKTETTTTDSTTADSTTMAHNDGWVKIFDGTSAAGWHQYGKGTVTERWKITDGALSVDTAVKSEGDLVTNDEYENFDLKLEWKISLGGNSGIIFYVHEDTAKYKNTYETGPEMQVVDNERHPDGKLVRHQAGDLYDMIACSKKTVKPAGEWNQVEIKSLNGKLDFFLNGENVVSTTMWDDNWKNLVAKSKFKGWPGFGIFKKGHIALQDHGGVVSYRNIEIKKM